MDQRVTLITLGVRDLERAQAFYERLAAVDPAANLNEGARISARLAGNAP